MKKLLLPFTFLTVAGLMMSFALLGPSIEFDKKEHNFGNIPQGTPVTHEFTFTNTGDAPLILESVKASCGCTTPAWPKEPIAPGAEGVIKATFNAAAGGSFNKSITVKTNINDESVILKLRGVVDLTSKVDEPTESAPQFNPTKK